MGASPVTSNVLHMSIWMQMLERIEQGYDVDLMVFAHALTRPTAASSCATSPILGTGACSRERVS